jgi:glycogen debranching enzyme
MRIKRQTTERASRTSSAAKSQKTQPLGQTEPEQDVVVSKKNWQPKEAIAAPAPRTKKTVSAQALKKLGNDPQLAKAAAEVLTNNDMGFAVKPSPHLYPHQWNWDSGFIAIGLATFDEKRAQREVLQLLRTQWKNGMIAHVIFNPEAKTYFPGPDVWQSERSKSGPVDKNGKPVATSGHTQPPVLALAARKVYERSSDPAQSLKFLKEAYPRLKKYQEFFYKHRDIDGDGLIYTVHPWETGRDNGPEWVNLMSKIELGWQPVYERRDTKIVDASERPTKEQYDRFVYLVELYRQNKYDPKKIEEKSPFLAQDVLMNALLYRSNEDLLWAAKELHSRTRSLDTKRSLEKDMKQIEGWMEKTRGGFEKLWDDKKGLFYSWDVKSDRRIDINSVATFLPLFAGVASEDQARRLVEEHLENTEEYALEYPVPSTAKNESKYFDPKKYWLGPAWINTNWMIIRGLERYGYTDLAQELEKKTLDLVKKTGFFEYFNANTGAGCGGDDFSWTAALVLDLIYQPTGTEPPK